MTAVDRIEQYLKEHRFISLDKAKEMGYKAPWNAMSYLNSRGHDIISVKAGELVGSFRVPERGYYLIEEAPRRSPETAKEEPKTGEGPAETAEERPKKTIDGLITVLADKCRWYENMDCGGTLSVKIMKWVIEELEEIKVSA